MPLLLVSTVLKYIDKCPKNPFLSGLAIKKYLKIVLYVSSKNVAIAKEFIIAVVILKAKPIALDIGKFT